MLLALAGSFGAILGTGIPASGSTSSSPGRTALIQRLMRAVSGLDATGKGADSGQQSGRATREPAS
jgi:hypothetical protein